MKRKQNKPVSNFTKSGAGALPPKVEETQENSSRLKRILRNFFRESLDFLGGMFPQTREERFLFFTAFASYFILSMIVYVRSDVIDHIELGYWGYLGYDNAWYSNCYFSLGSTEGYFLSRHPFIKLFFLPLAAFVKMLTVLAGKKSALFLFILVFNSITSLSVLGVYRFLRDLRLSIGRAVLLTTLFASFFANIILSFTPESFPITQLILIAIIVQCGRFLQENRELPFTRWFVWTFFGSGITVTNGVCTSLLLLLTKGPVIRKVKMIVGGAALFVGLYLLYFIPFGSVFFFVPEGKTFSQCIYVTYIGYNKNVSPMKYSPLSPEYADFCLNRFWNNSLIAPPLAGGTDPTLNHVSCEYAAPQVIVPDNQALWFSVRTGTGLLLFLLTLVGMTAVWKNSSLRFPLALFLFNVLLHLVLLFGNQEPHIYADHWIFIVPMSLAGLYLLTTRIPSLKYVIDFLLILITIATLLLNLNAFRTFLELAVNA